MRMSLLVLCLLSFAVGCQSAEFPCVDSPKYLAPAMYGDLAVFSCSPKESVWAVNTKTGKMVWEYDASGCIDLGPCLDGTTAYFWRGQSFASVFWDRILPASGPCAVDCMTGRCLWRRRVLGYPASSRPFVVGGLAFFPAVTEDTYVIYAYDKQS